MAITNAMRTEVSQLYVALFNRAPDGEGLGFWVQQRDNGASLVSIANTMYAVPAARTYYPDFYTNQEIIASFYKNALGRDADATGLAFWTAKLNEQGATPGSVITQMINVVANYVPAPGTPAAEAAAGEKSKALFNNRTEVAQWYGEGNGNIAGATSILTGVTEDPKSVEAIKAGSVPVSGDTFTLTTGVDTLTGTVGNDTFVATATATNAAGTPFAAASTSLNTADKLVGGAGIDALNITVDGAENAGGAAYNLPAADVSGIEIINVRNVATDATDTLTVNAGNFVGATEFYSDRSTTDMVFTNVAAGSTVGFKGNGTNAATGDVTATYLAGVTAANVSLQGGHSTTAGANTATLTVNGANLTSATITASGGGTNTIAGVVFGGAVTALTVDAQSNIATGNITGLAAGTKVTVKGAGTANIGTLLATNVTEVDASANTGGVTATLNNVTGLKFTGGAGNDVLTTGAALAGAGLVDAGAGTGDRLVVAATGHVTADAGKLYKNFEQLQVQDSQTVNLDHLSSTNAIGAVRINQSATGNTGATNLTAEQAANVSIIAAGGTGAITIGVKGATTGGQIDTVKAALTTTTAAGAAQPIDLTGLVLAGVEKLELTGNGTVAATTGAVTFTATAATALDSIKFANAANGNSLDVTAVAAANLVVDASASAGSVTIDASTYSTTTGATLKGGSSFDVLLGSVRSDTLTGGAGNDVIAGTAVGVATAGTATTIGSVGTSIAAATAADTLSGGEGRDVFAIGRVNDIANISSITDLNLGGNTAATGVDALYFDLATPAAAGASTIVVLNDTQKAAILAATDLAAAVEAALQIGSGANNVVQFTYGSDIYLAVNGATAGFAVADDALVKITGVVGTLDASDIVII